MVAVTGITGKVGSQVARALLAQGQAVRAVVRSRAKGDEWAALGCDVFVATIDDAEALTEAFRGVDGVFLMTPPNYDPEPGFPDTQRNSVAIRTAIEESRPGKVVFLSTVGAQVTETNLLNNSGMTEAMLRTVPVPVVHSFLQPLDHRIPMVATEDIAQTAVELLGQSWNGVRIVELEGPERYSSNDVAAALASALRTPVRNEIVPRSTWEELFRSQGMKNPHPRIRMVDGFNEGWIDFESEQHGSRKAGTTLQAALQALVSEKQS
jgi:NAD(P)H dehydrogenase (quinone)